MCCRGGRKIIAKEIIAEVNNGPTSNELQQWVSMMKCMLQCAEISMAALSDMKDKLDFPEEDMQQFEELFSLLGQIRRQLAPSCIGPTDSSTQSPPFEFENFGTQMIADGYEEKRKAKKDACLCKEFTKDIIRKSRKKEVTVCSKATNSFLINETCKGCSALRADSEASEPIIEGDEDSPLIVKSKGGTDFCGSGLGYDVFYAMRKYADRVAQYMEETNETQTFQEMCRDCISIAIKLRKKGFNEDSIICLSVVNTKYACLPYIAGLFIGSQMNALDSSFHVSDIAYLMKMVTPDIIFVDSVKIPDIQAALKQEGLDVELVAIGNIEGYESIDTYLEASDEEIQNFKPYKTDAPDRTCIILFSSGTSGLPKGICLTHQNMMTQMALATSFGYLSKVFMSYTSFYWISAVTFLLVTCLGGVARVVPLSFEVNRAYQLIQKYKVDCLFLGPFECVMMVKLPQPPDADASSLKNLVTAGASLKEIIFLELRRKFPGCNVNQLYGQTEVGGTLTRFSSVKPDEAALSNTRPLSCGLGFAGFWYKVVDKSGKIIGPHERGELYVKSDTMIMKGYYKLDSTDCFDQHGWLRTGDMVYYDDYHCFFIVDRVKELIKYRGWHIPPILLENILMSHPAVIRAIVIGIPHDEDGEHAMGLIIVDPRLDPATIDLKEIEEFVNSQVDEKKRLRAGVRIIPRIPLTATGKVRRISLRDAILKGEEID